MLQAYDVFVFMCALPYLTFVGSILYLCSLGQE